jgi:hypothetical protein
VKSGGDIMNRTRGIIVLLLSLLLFTAPFAACRQQPTGTAPGSTESTAPPENINSVYTSMKFTPLPGDTSQQVSGLMVKITLDDLVSQSDTIIVGKVIEILRPQWGTSSSAARIIYTDVIVNNPPASWGASGTTKHF